MSVPYKEKSFTLGISYILKIYVYIYIFLGIECRKGEIQLAFSSVKNSLILELYKMLTLLENKSSKNKFVVFPGLLLIMKFFLSEHMVNF